MSVKNRFSCVLFGRKRRGKGGNREKGYLGGFILLLLLALVFVLICREPVEEETPSPPEGVEVDAMAPDSIAEEPITAGPSYPYQIHFINVGQGDAVLIRSHDHNMLVDGGGRNSGLVKYLKELGIRKLDIVMASHPHADHIGGLIEVLEAFIVYEVIDNQVPHTTQTYNEYLTVIDRMDIPFTRGIKGLERKMGEGAYFEILHPRDPAGRDLNNASLVANVSMGELNVLLTGDIEKEVERSLVKDDSLALRAEILKVPHHGSSSSNSAAFLEAVSPRISIIMCGDDNRYGHPHTETLQWLQGMDTEVYRTDVHGTVVVSYDGEEYFVVAERMKQGA